MSASAVATATKRCQSSRTQMYRPSVRAERKTGSGSRSASSTISAAEEAKHYFQPLD